MARLRNYPFVGAAANVDWRQVNPDLLAKVNQLGRSLGKVIMLTSGYRTFAQQQQLYARYKNSGFKQQYIAAKPGQSNHERGLAVDATVDGVPLGNAVPAKQLAAFGLKTLAGDAVHTELAGAAQPTAAGAPSQPQPSAQPQPQVQPDATIPAIVPPPATIPPAGAAAPTGPGLPTAGGTDFFIQPNNPAEAWQTIAQIPDLSPETQRMIQLAGAQ